MFKKRLILALALGLAWGISPSANAGTMNLDNFVDQSPATIDLPATDLLMATINTSGTQGGNDATATTVTIGGSVVAADIASVCVDYNVTPVNCATSPGSLTNISISLPGNQKGGAAFDYRVTLNSSAAGETIQLTVESITNTNLNDNIPLPASTATRTVAGGATPAVVATLPATLVTDSSARMWGDVTTDGSPGVSTCGVDWGTTSGGPYSEGTQSVACSGTGQFFVDVLSGLTPDTPYYYIAWADNGVRADAPTEQPFTTSPAASPPTVSTRVVPVPSITADSAEMGGDVTLDGGATVTDRGVYWQSDTPGAENGTQVPMGSGTGEYFQTVSGLPSGKTIYYRAYAVNSAGEQLGNELNFSTPAGPPTVGSPTVADIAATSATLGGTMSSDGGEAPGPAGCGIEWGTTSGGPYPNQEPDGACVEGTPFTVSVPTTGPALPTGTTVYFRAYATNSQGTGFSAQTPFTPAGQPIVTATTPVTNILLKSATMGGEVTNDGGSPVTARGIVWDTAAPPEAAGTFVPMGSGIGVFSQTVSGLPAGDTIFWKAYATNSIDTAYSGQEQFDTLSEPTAQVSNLAFPTVAGRSMRITWTRGNGDGAIVVMRLSATGRTDPADGDDYTADPDFTAAPSLVGGAGNLVVYKGAGTSAIVTGLTMTTDYTVAVYEYAGTAGNTDYLLTPLEELSDTTTDYAVHNYDYGVDCGNCHDHGSFNSRDTELKAICETCHNDLGVAAAKLEFDNHLTPNSNPAVDFVDCGVCHEVHNLSVTNTTESFNNVTLVTQHNKSFLRANVDKYISTSVPPAYLHTDQPKRVDPHPDAPQDAVTPDRAVEGGDDAVDPSDNEQARGYCQVCHTLTSYHTNNPGTSGSSQTHDGQQNNSGLGTEANCGECHQHNNKFIGVGGSQTCIECHDSLQGGRPIITTQFDLNSTHIPGGSAAVTEPDCLVCHDQGAHTGGIVSTWDADDGSTAYTQPGVFSSTLATGEGEAFAPHCLSCHDSNGANYLPGAGDQTPLSPFIGSGAPPIIDATAWASASHNIPTPSSTPMTCVGDGANGCHGSGHGSEQNKLLAPADTGPAMSMTDFCFECHDSDGPSSFDIQSDFAAWTHPSVTSGSGAPADQKHSLPCAECHSVHADNATNPVLNIDTGAPLAAYSDNLGSYGVGSDPTFGVPQPDYIEFCLVCHDNTPPPGVTIPGGMVDMSSAWFSNDQHGTGDGNGSGNGYLKPPFNSGTGEPGNFAALNCTTCHGAHGSGNIFNLRTSINVGGTQMTVGGWLGDTIGEDPLTPGVPRNNQTVYTLPLTGGVQVDHDWGAWCSFCHQHESHGRDEDVACTSGHMHGAKQF